MSLDDLLATAGLTLVSGHLRAEAALSSGLDIEATDGMGHIYRISMKGNQPSVVRIESDADATQSPVLPVLVRSVDIDVHQQLRSIRIGDISSNPANGRTHSTFSFRAECKADAALFLQTVKEAGYFFDFSGVPDESGLPDFEVEMHTNATLEQLRDVMRSIEDSQVMIQTLRQVPLAVNSLERDYEIA